MMRQRYVLKVIDRRGTFIVQPVHFLALPSYCPTNIDLSVSVISRLHV